MAERRREREVEEEEEEDKKGEKGVKVKLWELEEIDNNLHFLRKKNKTPFLSQKHLITPASQMRSS